MIVRTIIRLPMKLEVNSIVPILPDHLLMGSRQGLFVQSSNDASDYRKKIEFNVNHDIQQIIVVSNIDSVFILAKNGQLSITSLQILKDCADPTVPSSEASIKLVPVDGCSKTNLVEIFESDDGSVFMCTATQTCVNLFNWDHHANGSIGSFILCKTLTVPRMKKR